MVPSRPASEARSPLHCRPSERINRLELTVEPAELTVEPAESSQDQPCGPQPASERSSTPSANEGKFTVVVPKRVLYTDDCTSACSIFVTLWLGRGVDLLYDASQSNRPTPPFSPHHQPPMLSGLLCVCCRGHDSNRLGAGGPPALSVCECGAR